jgi:hypothetical protein
MDDIINKNSSSMYGQNWKQNEHISREIKEKADLIKILKSNTNVIKEASKAMVDWDLLEKHFWIAVNMELINFPNWEDIVVAMSRFSMDVYTVCRIVKSQDQNKLLIYAGNWHTDNISRMLTDLGYSSRRITNGECA